MLIRMVLAGAKRDRRGRRADRKHIHFILHEDVAELMALPRYYAGRECATALLVSRRNFFVSALSLCRSLLIPPFARVARFCDQLAHERVIEIADDR